MRGKSATFARVSAAVAGLLIAFWGPAMAYGDSFSFDFSTAGYTTSPDAEIVDLGAFFVARIKQRPDWIVGAHKRRVKITVENPGSLVTDYPIALGISSHSKQELFNFIQELSGGDLVVTTSDGQTQLPTWVEELRDESSPISCPNASRVITGLTPVSEPVTTLDTKSLVYRVDEIQYSVTFAGTSLSLDDLVMQINSHGGPLRARRFGQRIQLLPPPGFQPYDFHFEIVSGTDAAAVLGVAIGEYSTDDVDPVTNGMFLPCAVIWFRAPQLSTGITSFFLYFDDFTAGPPDPLSGEDVFSSSTRRGTHVLLSDRQSAANLQLASFTFGADTRIETSSLFLETFIDFDQFVVVPPAYTSLASIVSSTRPLAGLYDMPSGDALQPLMTASREFHFPVLGSPAKDDTIFIYASEADVRVELEEWTFNIGSQTSTKVKNQTVDLTQFQHQSVNFDPGPNSVVTLRTSCPPATPPPCTPPRVVAFYRAAQTGNFVDGMPMLPPATDLWGIRGAELGLNAGHQLTPTITGIGPTTIVKRYLSDSSVTTYNLRVGAVVNENDPPGINGNGLAVHVKSTLNGRRISAIQLRDGSGIDGAPFMRYFDLGRRFLIPRPIGYLAVVATEASTICTLRYGECSTDGDCLGGASCIAQRCELEQTSPLVGYPTPGKVVFGETRAYNGCMFNSDCDTGLVCVPSSMTCGCQADGDCQTGQSCFLNRCIYPLETPVSNPVNTSSGPQSVDFNRPIELFCSKRVYALVDDAENHDESVLLAPKMVRPLPPTLAPVARHDATVEHPLVQGVQTVTTPFVNPPGAVTSWDGFFALEVAITGFAEVTYQLGVGSDFYYYDSDSNQWQIATDFSQSNTGFEVQAFISTGWSAGPPADLRVRVILRSLDGETVPQVSSITLDYTLMGVGGDVEAPDAEEDTFVIEPDLAEPDLEEDTFVIEPDLAEPDLEEDTFVIEPDLAEPDLEEDTFVIEPDLAEPDLVGPPLPTSLEIVPIPNQLVGQDFIVTIRALDPSNVPLVGFNETIEIDFPNSSLSPETVTLIDGVGTLTVNVGLPTNQMRVHATYMHPSSVILEAESNPFDVTGGVLSVVFLPNGAAAQPAPVNTVLPIPFLVQVNNGTFPAAFQTVTFTITAGAAYLDPLLDLIEVTAITDGSGQAWVILRTAGQTGPVHLVAESGGDTSEVVINVAPAPPYILDVSAPGKLAPIGGLLPQPILVTLKTSTGVPVVSENLQIQFYELSNLVAPGVSYTPSFQQLSNGSGQAQFQASFSTPGAYYLIVTAPGVGISTRVDGFQSFVPNGDVQQPDADTVEVDLDLPDLDLPDLAPPDLDQPDLDLDIGGPDVTDDVTALDLADAPAPDGSTDDAAPDGSTDDAAPSTDVDASPDLAQADTVGADQSVSDVQGSGSPDLSGLRFVGGGGCSALEPGASGGGAPLFLLLLAFVGWGWRRRRSEGSA